MTDSQYNNPFAAKPWACLGVAATGTFMATLDGGIVNVALPTIAKGFQAGLPLSQWVVSAYLLVISCLLPVFGRLGDMSGRRAKHRLGFLIFALASALCAMAPSIWSLIAARGLQAVGAALLMANGPAIVILSFPGPERGRAMGMIGMAVSLGSLAGPAVGGWLMGAYGWPAIFYVNVPVGLLGMYLAHTVLPDDRKKSTGTFDYRGSGLYAVGIVSLLLAVSHGGEWGWTSVLTLGCTGLAAVCLTLFFRRQTKIPHPMLDTSLFRIRALAVGNLASMCAFMGLFSNTILLPFVLIRIIGMPPGETGLLMAMLPMAMVVSTPLCGLLSEKVNPALLTGLGLFIVAAALYSQTMLTPAAGYWRVAYGQMALGIGFGMFLAPNNSAVLGSAPRSKSGVAGSLMAMVRNLGMVCGIALASSVFESFRNSALAAGAADAPAFLLGFKAALHTGAAVTLFGAMLAFLRPRKNAPPEAPMQP